MSTFLCCRGKCWEVEVYCIFSQSYSTLMCTVHILINIVIKMTAGKCLCCRKIAHDTPFSVLLIKFVYNSAEVRCSPIYIIMSNCYINTVKILQALINCWCFDLVFSTVVVSWVLLALADVQAGKISCGLVALCHCWLGVVGILWHWGQCIGVLSYTQGWLLESGRLERHVT